MRDRTMACIGSATALMVTRLGAHTIAGTRQGQVSLGTVQHMPWHAPTYSHSPMFSDVMRLVLCFITNWHRKSNNHSNTLPLASGHLAKNASTDACCVHHHHVSTTATQPRSSHGGACNNYRLARTSPSSTCTIVCSLTSSNRFGGSSRNHTFNSVASTCTSSTDSYVPALMLAFVESTSDLDGACDRHTHTQPHTHTHIHTT